ncbi:MAG TPA: hypothetical protein ENN39_03375 [Desulfonatronum sp.]|nr:hypothetical protein [Desulfonatronum sp.]
MKKMAVVALLILGLAGTQVGCGRFLGGAAVGAAGVGAAYELRNKQQMDRLEQEYKDGKITQEEYESRKEQIRRGSIIY